VELCGTVLPDVTFCLFAVDSSVVVCTFFVKDVAALVVFNSFGAGLIVVTSCVVSLMCFNVDNCTVLFWRTCVDVDMMYSLGWVSFT